MGRTHLASEFAKSSNDRIELLCAEVELWPTWERKHHLAAILGQAPESSFGSCLALATSQLRRFSQI
jgi:hypothetical protein